MLFEGYEHLHHSTTKLHLTRSSHASLLLLLHELFIRASCFTSDGITVIVSHTCQRRLICKPTCFDSSDPMSWRGVIILFIDHLSPLTGRALRSISIQKQLWETVHIRFALQNITRWCCQVLQHKREKKNHLKCSISSFRCGVLGDASGKFSNIDVLDTSALNVAFIIQSSRLSFSSVPRAVRYFTCC